MQVHIRQYKHTNAITIIAVISMPDIFESDVVILFSLSSSVVKIVDVTSDAMWYVSKNWIACYNHNHTCTQILQAITYM